MSTKLDLIISANRRYFDGQTLSYLRMADTYRPRMRTLFAEHFLPFLNREDNHAILEIGPGAGLLVEYVLDAGLSSVALDVSPRMLHRMREAIERTRPQSIHRLEVLCDDVRSLRSLHGRMFQAIVLQAIIHLFPKRYALGILSRLVRHLVPGGYIWLSSTVHGDVDEGFYIDANPGRHSGLVPGVSSFRAYYRRTDLRLLVEQSGLIVVREIEDADNERDHPRAWLTLVCRRPPRYR